jgi:hypothetical protein
MNELLNILKVMHDIISNLNNDIEDDVYYFSTAHVDFMSYTEKDLYLLGQIALNNGYYVFIFNDIKYLVPDEYSSNIVIVE